MKQINYTTITLLLLLLTGCGIGTKPAKVESTNKVTTTKPKFLPPSVPTHIVDQQEQIKYVVNHYWDGYNFADTLLLSDEKVTGEAFAGFAQLLGYTTPEATEEGINIVLTSSFKAGNEAFALFTKLFEDYFYNANSPYLNEELYIHALRYIVNNDKIDDINKIRPKFQLEMALKNRVNHKATNFRYTLKSGDSASMHDIQAEYTLLYFNNPDCHDCERVMKYITSSKVLTKLQADGKLKILSIYPDADLDLWLAAKYPDIMINGYDKGQKISTEQLYDLKAIPTLYLLDSQKHVLLKDAPVELIEMMLSQKNTQQAN